MTALKLGSLFDGIGVFPLAAVHCGMEPVWASEIEARPISITKRHFPDMLHLGDITRISGAEIPPVDVITFGSGLVADWHEKRFRGPKIQPVLSGNANYRGDEICNKRQVSSFHCLGKRCGSVFFK